MNLQDSSPILRISEDLDELSDHAAKIFTEAALSAVKRESRFTVCLSGGSTPRRLYGLLAQKQISDQIPWQKVHIFWGDERCVPLGNPDNHFSMTSELLLNHVPIPPENIHPMHGEYQDPEQAAREYESHLTEFFGLEPGEFPSFDLILLGMGDDGHTASLYPGSPGLMENRLMVFAHYIPQRQNHRLTLTFPVINSAHRVVFLVAGAEKAEALRSVLEDEKGLNRPAMLIDPTNGTVTWLVDRAAAGLTRKKADSMHGGEF